MTINTEDEFKYTTPEYNYSFMVFGINNRKDMFDVLIEQDGDPFIFKISEKEIMKNINNNTLRKLEKK